MVSFLHILASTLLLLSTCLAAVPTLDDGSFNNDAEVDKVRQSYHDAFLLAQIALLYPGLGVFTDYFPAAWQPSVNNLFGEFVLAQAGEPVGTPGIANLTISRALSDDPECEGGCVGAYTQQQVDGGNPVINICDGFFKYPTLAQLSPGESYSLKHRCSQVKLPHC